MNSIQIFEPDIASAPWQQIHSILDSCYPKPPRDVFFKLISLTHTSQRIWVAQVNNEVAGIVMLSPHSKGGHLENLSVLSDYRSQGIAQYLVRSLINDVSSDSSKVITLTTRIPSFFEKFGFTSFATLNDDSVCMSLLC